MSIFEDAFNLDAPVGGLGRNKRADVFKVENTLDKLNYLDL